MRTIMFAKFPLLGLVCGLALSACGDNVTEVTQGSSDMEFAKSTADFDKCDSSAIGETAFATDENAAYICSDSGWVPFSQKNSGVKSCRTEALSDSSGYKIVCGEDSVGVLLNGEKGATGKTGEKGATGKTGTSCTAELLGDSSGYKIVCGKDSVEFLQIGEDDNGCSLTDNGDGSFKQACGTDTVTLYKAICGYAFYDPAKSFCVADSVYALCDGHVFDPEKNFCKENILYGHCGNVDYDSTKAFCYEGSLYSCNREPYEPVKAFCYEDSLYSCSGWAYDPSLETCESGKIFSELTDARDGNIYRTVKIATQTWMAENLNYVYPKLAKSINFPDEEGDPSNFYSDSISFCYNNNPEYCEQYGRLYTWAAAMDSVSLAADSGKVCGYKKYCTFSGHVRGACPEGWHLPSQAEWETLESYVEANSSCGRGQALKSTSGWDDNANGLDVFGFNALPAGHRYDDYSYVRREAYFWTSSEFSTTYTESAYTRSPTSVSWGGYPKYLAQSVRCVKD